MQRFSITIMNNSVKRRFAAWLLLLVFVPVMVATSLHIHDLGEASSVECEQCLHHVHHAGHFNVYADHAYDCVLCQFAALPFVAAAVVALAIAVAVHRVAYVYIIKGKSLGVCGVKSTRAPPILF